MELYTHETEQLQMIERLKLVGTELALQLVAELAKSLAFSYCESPCLNDGSRPMSRTQGGACGWEVA